MPIFACDKHILHFMHGVQHKTEEILISNIHDGPNTLESIFSASFDINFISKKVYECN